MLDFNKPLAYKITMTPKELKQWREANGYSQDKLAKALSVHIMTVSRWERGTREIPPFLKLALGYLELRKEKPKPKQTKSTKEKVKREENVYGEYLQTWSRFLNSVLPKW